MSVMEKWLDCHCHVLGGGTEAVRELDEMIEAASRLKALIEGIE